MIRRYFRRSLVISVVLLTTLPVLAAWNISDYHDLGEVRAALDGLAKGHPGLISVETIGQSAGGRPILLARIAASGPTTPDERPAVFVGANIAGWYNSGTEAALDLIETLVSGDHGDLLSRTTFYVAPALNPDAHDGLFAVPRVRRHGNAQSIDYDRDGLVAEDDYEDLDRDGRITTLRIPDPNGQWQPHPDDPRVMVRRDSAKGWAGGWRLEKEGDDSDGDGSWNEDPGEGTVVDMNFAHVFPYPDPKAGPWASYAPESKAIMDWLLGHRNIALAFVYGPANNLLETPRSLGGGGDLGTQKFKIPEDTAQFMGLDPEEEYTIDQVWEVAQSLPFVQQNNVTKEQIAQFLGAGPATKLEDPDVKVLDRLASDYKKLLEEAGLDKERPAEQYGKGGFTPWLYYQYGVPAYELDVWGVPKKKEEKSEGETAKLTVDSLEEMSSEDFVALGEEPIDAFLKEIKAPAHFTAKMAIERVESGQVTPKMMAGMIRQMGGGAAAQGSEPGEDDPATKRMREVIDWVSKNVPEGWSDWSAAGLADGTGGEAGGLDPFVTIAPPMALLQPALDVHSAFVIDVATELPQVALRSVEVEPLGSGVYRVRAVAVNDGGMATHSAMAKRAQAKLPVRLELATGRGVELVAGKRAVTSERLEPKSDALEGTWLVRGDGEVVVTLSTQGAGGDSRNVKLNGRNR